MKAINPSKNKGYGLFHIQENPFLSIDIRRFVGGNFRGNYIL